MTPEEMRALFDYNTWANRRSLEAAASLSNEQFIKPLVSSFPSVCDAVVQYLLNSGKYRIELQ